MKNRTSPVRETSERYVRGLLEDHARFSRVLTMIGRDARRLVDAPSDVLPLFAEAVDYVVNFQNVYHHPREEIMFSRVGEKSESLAAAAKKLAQEHGGTAYAGKELLALIDHVSRAPGERAGREQLAKGLERFARSMRSHIAQEEDLLYSQVWIELTRRDWDKLIGQAAALDPLDHDHSAKYPLLVRYVSEGRTRSDVTTESSPFGEALGSAMDRIGTLLDGLAVIDRTMSRQRKEACALARKSIRAMPIIPALQPMDSVRAGMQSAGEFASAYRRWFREWNALYSRSDTATRRPHA